MRRTAACAAGLTGSASSNRRRTKRSCSRGEIFSEPPFQNAVRPLEMSPLP
jgi:hypothetical protein